MQILHSKAAGACINAQPRGIHISHFFEKEGLRSRVPLPPNYKSNCLPSTVCKAKGFGVPKTAPQPSTPSGTQPAQQDLCPCASQKSYKNCCQKIHSGAGKAKTAESALRARFSAYNKNQTEYIKVTTHPDYYDFHYMKPEAEVAQKFKQDVEYACSAVAYADFKVMKSEQGAHDSEFFVAFSYRHASKAEADDQGKWSVTQQKCRFLKVDDMWQFVDYQTYGYNMSQLAQDVKPEKTSSA